MASSGRGLRIGIQILLAIVIAGLGYWLYLSITEPYKAIEREQELTRITRLRMDDIRAAMIRYEVVNSRYPSTLDSLITFVKEDSLFQANPDSVFGPGFNPDSLAFSPRSGRQFELAVNDTARVKTYLLEDPDSDDYIGTLESDVTRINTASWE